MISWDAVDNATGYELFWRLLDEESDYQRIRNFRGRTEVPLRNLTASSENIVRQYSVMVTSVRNQVEGGSSPKLTFTNDLTSKCSYILTSNTAS